jgi:ABC-type nitrate/sulfonate/bicarbonate transport system permease component
MQADSAHGARLWQVFFLVLIGLVWFAITRAGLVSPIFLPAPEKVLPEFVRLLGSGAFVKAVQITFVTMLKAFGIAAIGGVLAGYLITRSRFATAVLEPLVAGLFAVPLTLFFPLFILLLGIGPASKVGYGALYGFFPVALSTIAGLSNIDTHFLRAARSMGAQPMDLVRHVLLPAAQPAILTGLRIGFLVTFASVLGGETLSSVAGIGRSIAHDAELMDTAQMYAWIVFVVLTTTTLNMLLSALEERGHG